MQTSAAGLSNSTSHAGLGNLASYFKRGSEQLRVPLQARVWATLRPDWDVRVYNKHREVRIHRETCVSVITDPNYMVN